LFLKPKKSYIASMTNYPQNKAFILGTLISELAAAVILVSTDLATTGGLWEFQFQEWNYDHPHFGIVIDNEWGITAGAGSAVFYP
jgi:hypothetical protein